MLNQITTIVKSISLEQLADILQKLSPAKKEELDLLLDKNLQTKVMDRGKTAWQEHENGETVSLEDMQKEFLY